MNRARSGAVLLGIYLAGGLAGARLYSQTEWTKHPQNPVIVTPGGCSGDWDCRTIHSVSVLLDGDTYRMWYVARAGQDVASIGYATSPDGIAWTKHPGNPVIVTPGGCSGDWDCRTIHSVTVLLDGDT